MTQKTIKIFVDEFYSKGTRSNYATNKTIVYFIDNVWSSDIFDVRDYGPENKKIYRNVLVVIDIFRRFGWTIPF